MAIKITVRIWKGSPLIKKKVKYIEEKFQVKIDKISRGKQASDSREMILEEADYITFNGNNDDCLELAKATSSKTEQRFEYGWSGGKLLMNKIPLTKKEKELLTEITKIAFKEMGERTRIGSVDDESYVYDIYNQLKKDNDAKILVEIVFKLCKQSLDKNG